MPLIVALYMQVGSMRETEIGEDGPDTFKRLTLDSGISLNFFIIFSLNLRQIEGRT